MDCSFTLDLIRHAPTESNLEKRYLGWTDESVLPFAAEADPAVTDVRGSDLVRCRETAAVLFPNAEYTADPDFRECHFGDWERKTYDQLKADPHYRQWIDNPELHHPPGGESLTEMAERIDRAVLKLPDTASCIIVAHGGPIRYLIAKALKEEFAQQIARHGYRYRLTWVSRNAFGEGQPCISFSEVHLTANGNSSKTD